MGEKDEKEKGGEEEVVIFATLQPLQGLLSWTTCLTTILNWEVEAGGSGV